VAKNFQIRQHRNSDNLHLKLFGVFDATSALELIHTIEANAGDSGKVFVHTCSLSDIKPFGQCLFRKRMAGKIGKNLVITGRFSEQMGPLEKMR